jgi:transketolase
LSVPDATVHDCRTAFAATLEALAQNDERVVVVVNDSVGSSKLDGFAKRFPDRLINVGIAEQDMVGIAAGLANSGRLPFVCGASCFMTARALEQIKVDLAYTNANVTLCGMSPGVAYGQLGPTHHSVEDVAWLRAIANMVIVVPADPLETGQALRALKDYEGPSFLRVSRMPVPAIYTAGHRFELGRAVRLRDGSDVTLVANGTMLWRALAAAEALAEDGVSARVVAVPTVKPLDVDELVTAAAETRGLVTVEEHTVFGGLGSAVSEVVASHHPARVKMLGIPGVFAPTGTAEWLLDFFALNPSGIHAAALQVLDEVGVSVAPIAASDRSHLSPRGPRLRSQQRKERT